MAFFQDGNSLCRDMWPTELADSIHALDDGQPLPAWRRVPTSFDELCERVTVDGVGTRKPQVLLGHPDLDLEGKLVSCTLRLQGIVESASMGALGNWTGEMTNAPKATQTLVLSAGGCVAAFEAQKRGVLHLEEVVLNAMSAGKQQSDNRGTSLHLTRRVFAKVDAEHDIPSIVFSPREDPKGKALRISHSWRVTHRIKTGVVGKDGQIALAHPIAIRRGDFVDCAVSVEVVTMRNKQGRKVMVHFSPREVVRLRGASDVNRLLRQPSIPAPIEQKVIDVVSGFSFTSGLHSGMVSEIDPDAHMEDAA